MDALTLSLAASGVVLTTTGLVVGAVDVADRISRYNRAASKPDPHPPLAEQVSAAQLGLSRRMTPVVAADLEHLRAAVKRMETRLADAAGVTADLRRLWLSAIVALVGVLLSGAADILAAVRAP